MILLIPIVLGCVRAQPPPRTARVNPEGRSLFVRTVQPLLQDRCAGCHAAPGCCSKFLEPFSDAYGAVKAWPRLIGRTPQLSLLYTKGEHEGPGFTPAQARTIANWIRSEAGVRAAR